MGHCIKTKRKSKNLSRAMLLTFSHLFRAGHYIYIVTIHFVAVCHPLGGTAQPIYVNSHNSYVSYHKVSNCKALFPVQRTMSISSLALARREMNS